MENIFYIDLNLFCSWIKSNFTLKAEAPDIQIPGPSIQLEAKDEDSLGNKSYFLKIAPNRPINRMELFELRDVDFKEFKVNGLKADDIFLGENAFHMFTRRWKERLLTYHADNRDTLRIEFTIEKGDTPEFVLYESAYNLLESEQLKVPKRSDEMIPRPFVLNDAIILKKTISLNK